MGPPDRGQDDEDDDEVGDRIELRGEIGNLTGSCPDIRFRLRNRSVVADGRTRFERGNCRSYRNGTDVDVRGVQLRDGTVRALRIRQER